MRCGAVPLRRVPDEPHAWVLSILLTACGGDDARRSQSADGAANVSEDQPLATTLVYECSGYKFIARRGAGEMALWLEDSYVVLPQVVSDSGTVYEAGCGRRALFPSFFGQGTERLPIPLLCCARG